MTIYRRESGWQESPSAWSLCTDIFRKIFFMESFPSIRPSLIYRHSPSLSPSFSIRTPSPPPHLSLSSPLQHYKSPPIFPSHSPPFPLKPPHTHQQATLPSRSLPIKDFFPKKHPSPISTSKKSFPRLPSKNRFLLHASQVLRPKRNLFPLHGFLKIDEAPASVHFIPQSILTHGASTPSRKLFIKTGRKKKQKTLSINY